MRRRHGTSRSAPDHLQRFDLADWPAEGGNDFERYESAYHRWDAARDAWADERGWEGDETWWMASHAAIVAMPDEPWDPSKI